MNPNLVDVDHHAKSGRPLSVRIGDRLVVVTGKWLKKAEVFDDEFLEGDSVSDPASFVGRVRESGLDADLFTFAQKVPDSSPRHSYHHEWDNSAVVPITTYSDWLEHRAEYDVRKGIRRSQRLGVIVKECAFDDAFVEGIRQIYNETPVKQGTAFWHYQKDFETVKRENSTYLERSAFIGAYFGDELIGFIRMVYVGRLAMTLQVIAKESHFNKKPMSALIAKAVEICAARGASHLIYGRYVYNNASNSLTEFKRRNGFEQILLPRYVVPLTLRGRLALALGLHRGLAARTPAPVLARVRKLRLHWSAWKSRHETKTA